jgi:glycosyltransferase involved in cell wall biosynthesis
MARILIVATEYEPFSASGVNRIIFFKKILELHGHFVAILSTVTAGQGLKANALFDTENNIYRAFTLSLLQRRLLSSKRLPIYPALAKTGKYATWIPFAVKKGKSLVKQLNIDLVFTSFPDFASVDVAEKIARLTETKLITDFRDPPYWIYDEVIVNKKTKACQQIIERAIALSHEIITCTEDSSQSLKDYYQFNTNTTVLANGFDRDIINQIINKKSKSSNAFELIHIGSFYDEGRDIKPVVRAIEESCKYTDKKIKLRLIGDIPDLATQKYLSNTAKSFTVSIEPPVPMIEALTIAKNSDALLLIQGGRFDRQIPTKIYEYLALNRPIWSVVGVDGATKKLLDIYSDNIVYSDYNNENHIMSEFTKLLNFHVTERNFDELSRQAQVEKLLALI